MVPSRQMTTVSTVSEFMVVTRRSTSAAHQRYSCELPILSAWLVRAAGRDQIGTLNDVDTVVGRLDRWRFSGEMTLPAATAATGNTCHAAQQYAPVTRLSAGTSAASLRNVGAPPPVNAKGGASCTYRTALEGL